MSALIFRYLLFILSKNQVSVAGKQWSIESFGGSLSKFLFLIFLTKTRL